MNQTKEALSAHVERIFQEILRPSDQQTREEWTRAKLPIWDSLQHAHLVIRLQNELGIRFTGSEIARMATYAIVLETVLTKKCIT